MVCVPHMSQGDFGKADKLLLKPCKHQASTCTLHLSLLRPKPGRYASAYAIRHLPYPNHFRSYLHALEGVRYIAAAQLHRGHPRHSCACLAMQVAGHLFEGRGSGSYISQYMLSLLLHALMFVSSSIVLHVLLILCRRKSWLSRGRIWPFL